MNLDIQTPRVFAPLLLPARYKGLHGGRGSGKSHFFGEALVEKCLMKPGLRWACIREHQNSLEQSVKRLIEDKIRKFNVSDMFKIRKSDIVTPGDGIIIFNGMKTHNADSIKSLEGYDGAWVEEAQSLSAASMELLRPTIRKDETEEDDESELWFSWNPRSPKEPVEKLLRNDPPENSIVIEANYEHNPWFPKVLRDEMEYDRARDPDKYQHVWRGKYQQASEARVFHNWTVEQFETDPDARFLFGADWGFSRDPTVLIRCYIKGRTLFIDREVYKIGCDIDYTPALFAGSNEKWSNPNGWEGIEGSLDWPIIADSARPETISYMSRKGFKIRGAKKGAGSIEDGIEFLKGYDVIIHPRCQHCIDEMTFYSFEVDPKTLEILPKLADKKNHVIDSIRYAVEGQRRAGRKPEYSTYGNG